MISICFNNLPHQYHPIFFTLLFPRSKGKTQQVLSPDTNLLSFCFTVGALAGLCGFVLGCALCQACLYFQAQRKKVTKKAVSKVLRTPSLPGTGVHETEANSHMASTKSIDHDYDYPSLVLSRAGMNPRAGVLQPNIAYHCGMDMRELNRGMEMV